MSNACYLGKRSLAARGTQFDHIKQRMWMGHTHKSGLLFEDKVIKLFLHILILWSFGRERSRRVKDRHNILERCCESRAYHLFE